MYTYALDVRFTSDAYKIHEALNSVNGPHAKAQYRQGSDEPADP